MDNLCWVRSGTSTNFSGNTTPHGAVACLLARHLLCPQIVQSSYLHRSDAAP